MKNKMTNKEVVEYIAKKLDTQKWDILNGLYKETAGSKGKLENVSNTVNDFLANLWGDQDYFEVVITDNARDIFNEYADSIVDIYNYDLYKSVPIFSDYIERAVDEGLADMRDFQLTKLISIGQYLFWSELGNEILDILEKLQRDGISE